MNRQFSAPVPAQLERQNVLGKLLLITASVVSLTACNARNDQVAAGANNAAAPATSMPSATTGNQAVSPPVQGSELANKLVGRWSNNRRCTMWTEYRADGSFALSARNVAPEVRWSVRGNELVFSAPGEPEESIGTIAMGVDRFEFTIPRAGTKATMYRCPT